MTTLPSNLARVGEDLARATLQDARRSRKRRRLVAFAIAFALLALSASAAIATGWLSEKTPAVQAVPSLERPGAGTPPASDVESRIGAAHAHRRHHGKRSRMPDAEWLYPAMRIGVPREAAAVVLRVVDPSGRARRDLGHRARRRRRSRRDLLGRAGNPCATRERCLLSGIAGAADEADRPSRRRNLGHASRRTLLADHSRLRAVRPPPDVRGRTDAPEDRRCATDSGVDGGVARADRHEPASRASAYRAEGAGGRPARSRASRSRGRSSAGRRGLIHVDARTSPRLRHDARQLAGRRPPGVGIASRTGARGDAVSRARRDDQHPPPRPHGSRTGSAGRDRARPGTSASP